MPRIMIKGGVWRNTEVRNDYNRLFSDFKILIKLIIFLG